MQYEIEEDSAALLFCLFWLRFEMEVGEQQKCNVVLMHCLYVEGEIIE
jgi:hypothetical protein